MDAMWQYASGNSKGGIEMNNCRATEKELHLPEPLTFGNYIKYLRKSKKMKLKDVSKRLGISLTLLSDIENGRRNPFSADRLIQFTKTMNLNRIEYIKLCDLKAKEVNQVPDDISYIFFNTPAGYAVRLLLREANKYDIRKN